MSQHEAWFKKEDYWAIIISLFLIFASTILFFSGAAPIVKQVATNFPAWTGAITGFIGALTKSSASLAALYVVSVVLIVVAARVMGYEVKRFAAGFTLLFAVSVIVSALGSNKLIKEWQLETPFLSLLIGIAVSNLINLPDWFKSVFRTEFYVKTGIVLMGATLPFTLLLQAGPAAIAQAVIVSVVTYSTIFFAATRIFKLDPKFGTTLAAGGSVCGVSAAIAVGGACRAKKEHVSMAITLVIIGAVAMIFILPVLSKMFGLQPGPAGAWIGTSEFADAAGFAAAEAIGDERAVKTFTLMKVIGRDMFVGLWALLAAFMAVTVWERNQGVKGEKVSLAELWHRFPKFIIGFFAASIFISIIIAGLEPKQAAQFSKDVVGPLKIFRGWAFTWTFLSIGFTTRFKDLTSVGWKPVVAFAIGVAVNVPLGYWLSTRVFVNYWLSI